MVDRNHLCASVDEPQTVSFIMIVSPFEFVVGICLSCSAFPNAKWLHNNECQTMVPPIEIATHFRVIYRFENNGNVVTKKRSLVSNTKRQMDNIKDHEASPSWSLQLNVLIDFMSTPFNFNSMFRRRPVKRNAKSDTARVMRYMVAEFLRMRFLDRTARLRIFPTVPTAISIGGTIFQIQEAAWQ